MMMMMMDADAGTSSRPSSAGRRTLIIAALLAAAVLAALGWMALYPSSPSADANTVRELELARYTTSEADLPAHRAAALAGDDPDAALYLCAWYTLQRSDAEAAADWRDILAKNRMLRAGVSASTLPRYSRTVPPRQYRRPAGITAQTQALRARALQYDDPEASAALLGLSTATLQPGDPGAGEDAPYWAEIHRKNERIATLWAEARDIPPDDLKELARKAHQNDRAAAQRLDLHHQLQQLKP
ncbi:hypothetical protein DB346_06695 [Verrucomicrobia bacterium LW23]|nr:hypothetical protein DB346_06695 [Verrucomicrobia bacterium LW23]